MIFKEWMKLIDTSDNGRVTKKELKAYFDAYVKDNKCDTKVAEVKDKKACPHCLMCPNCHI